MNIGRYDVSTVTVAMEGALAWVEIDNPPVNATSTAVRAGLLEAVEAAQEAKLAILKCRGRTFVAGGDMLEFDSPPQEPHLPDVVQAIEDSLTPFLCLLHGNVLGGGLEIAMGCAHRIAAPGTKFGLPEVNVGLIPGAGGTQRAPRLFGWEHALAMAAGGKTVSAEEALGLGAIDQIADDLDAAAKSFAPISVTPVSKRSAPPLDAAWMAAASQKIERQSKGACGSLENIDALAWATLPFEGGQKKERARHLELRQSEESRALRHVFFSERAVARPALIENAKPRPLRQIAVVGGGLMGAGIAGACLAGGYKVALIERSGEAVKSARDRVSEIVAGALKRGKIDQSRHNAQLAALTVHCDYAGAAGADLAIEAVFEDIKVKKGVFSALADTLPKHAILATNTSYLDPRDIFEGVASPERCLGLHFFSPAHIMRLMEIIHLPQTAEGTITTGFDLAKRLRKVAVLSGICDGFIGNRMLAAYRRAAEYMLADGALPQDIDAAMRSFGMAMGPFEAQDMSGLQIAEANRRRQDATRDPAERYVTISDALCEQGRLGRRSGKGWYRYDVGDGTSHVDPEVTAAIEAYSASQGIKRRAFSMCEIQDQLLAVLANEGALIVAEGIAESEGAVDVVKIHGYGFPRWRGGPMQTARAMGDARIKSALDAVSNASPHSWTRARRFR